MYKRLDRLKILWQSSSQDAKLSLPRAWFVLILVGELRSHKQHGQKEKKKKSGWTEIHRGGRPGEIVEVVPAVLDPQSQP